MALDYITKDNTIVFSPEYNKPLDSELGSHYKKIIFSDYALYDGLFEAYENSKFNGLNYIGSKFNQPLSNSFDNCSALTHINFGYHFNQPLANSLNNCTSLTHITFGFDFDKPLENSLDNCTALTYLTFDLKFNHPLGNSLDNFASLVHIGLGYKFNQKLDLPPNIRSLKLDSNNGNYIDYLPDTIEELELGVYFNLKLDNCPSSIKKIIFTGNHCYYNYNEELNCLPDGLSILGLPYNYKHKIQNIPRGLTKLVCSKDYSYQSDFVGVGIEVEIY